MEYSIVFETPLGDSIVLLTSQMHAQLLPAFILKFGEIQRFIPQLNLVIQGHTLTEAVYVKGHCKLRGQPVRWLSALGEG